MTAPGTTWRGNGGRPARSSSGSGCRTILIGRDGSTPSEIQIPPTKCKEALNVDFYQAAFARKRDGSSAVFSSTTDEAFTGIISALGRHVPGADETVAELWGVDSAA